MATLQQKVAISTSSALQFALLNLPFTYRLTNSLLPLATYDTTTNCPTNLGLLVHAIVFFLISFLTMGDPRERTLLKVKFSLYGTLIAFFLSSPSMYALTGSIFGSNIADANGCPTLMGVLLHAFVYFLALVGVMYLPDE